MAKISKLTIHCSATREGQNSSAAEVRAWDIERFGQPSYHWVIELDGAPVRHLNDNQRGAHVANNNSGNIGICYVGGLDRNGNAKDTRTFAQKSTLRKLVAEYRLKYSGIVVRGHNEWPDVAKACPCFSVTKEIQRGLL